MSTVSELIFTTVSAAARVDNHYCTNKYYEVYYNLNFFLKNSLHSYVHYSTC